MPIESQIMHPLVLVGLGTDVGEGLGLGLGNQAATSTKGYIIWQGCRIRHNTAAERKNWNKKKTKLVCHFQVGYIHINRPKPTTAFKMT